MSCLWCALRLLSRIFSPIEKCSVFNRGCKRCVVTDKAGNILN